MSSFLAAALLLVVVGCGTLSMVRLSSYRAAAADANRRTAELDSLAQINRQLSDASTVLREAGVNPSLATIGAALGDGLNVAAETTNMWRRVRNAKELDPEIVSRVDAWYAVDLRTRLPVAAATPDGTTLDLEPSRQAMLQQLELVRGDVLELRDGAMASLQDALTRRQRAATVELIVLGVVLPISALGVVAVGWSIARNERRGIRSAMRRRSREQLESNLKRALGMIDTEADAVAVLVRAAKDRSGGTLTALLSDSSRAHFHRTGDDTTVCSVTSPVACPAARQGQTQLFASSDSLEACPHLRPGDGATCGAICVPMAVEGTTIGVLHLPRSAGPVDHELASELEAIVGESSHRIGMIRSLGVSQTQASTDPLTGLPNRRHLEERLRSLRTAQVEIAVGFADLDNFKTLNDRHGHETGDKALSLFAGVCHDVLRKGDFVARFGGEEFVIVLPGCDESTAHEILDRLRAGLADACAIATFPPFTCSSGLAIAEPAEPINDILRRADVALLQAKRDGRDRIVLASDIPDDTTVSEPSAVC